MDVVAGDKNAEKRMRVENGSRLGQESSIDHRGEAELDCFRGDESEEVTVELSQEHARWVLAVHLHHWLDHSSWLIGLKSDSCSQNSFLLCFFWLLLLGFFALFYRSNKCEVVRLICRGKKSRKNVCNKLVVYALVWCIKIPFLVLVLVS